MGRVPPQRQLKTHLWTRQNRQFPRMAVVTFDEIAGFGSICPNALGSAPAMPTFK